MILLIPAPTSAAFSLTVAEVTPWIDNWTLLSTWLQLVKMSRWENTQFHNIIQRKRCKYSSKRTYLMHLIFVYCFWKYKHLTISLTIRCAICCETALHRSRKSWKREWKVCLVITNDSMHGKNTFIYFVLYGVFKLMVRYMVFLMLLYYQIYD